VDGLLWFAREVWPQVHVRHPEAEFDIVGRGLPQSAQAFLAQIPGLRLQGFQQELRPFYEKARLVVAPLRFGSGFKLKVLEAMAQGVPVLTSPVGAEGFTQGGRLPIQTCLSEKDWHSKIDRLLVEDEAWSVQSQVQRDSFLRDFTPESRGLKFNQLFEHLIPS
jgi:glycosyltransferase involved in cell wall biosynthesis